ncbi:MAG: MarR family transcriptional regulator [Pseudomonadota bacterium]
MTQKAPDPTVLFELFNEIGILSQLSRAELEARLPHGVGAPQFSVLNHLIRVQDGRPPLALAKAFQVPKTTMTHTLSVLEKLALVEMRPNPEDGRSKLVYITDKGRALRDQAILDVGAAFAPLAAALPAGLMQGLIPDLRELRKKMDENRSA